MSADHDKTFIRTFAIVLGILIAITIVAIIGAGIITRSDGTLRPEQIMLIQKRTDPVYRVITDPSAVQQVAMTDGGGGDAPLTAQEVYENVCSTCHTTGVAGAPKITNTAEWSARLSEKGLETLHRHAIDGFKAMPPKGGNPNLSDEEVRKAVDYILSQAGVQ